MSKFTTVVFTKLLAIIIFCTINSFAVKHTVSVSNFFFNPATLNVSVGDTIRWVWSSGFHTTTSTTIPLGSASWDAPIASASPTYEYKVTLPGSYNYHCSIHLSMVGSFTATGVTPTLAVTPPNQDVTIPAGSTTFSVTSNSSWTAGSNAGWCIPTGSGSGNGQITANFSSNPDISTRVASITVTVATLAPVTVTVTQAGAPVLSASASATPSTVTAGQPSQLDVTVSGGTGNYSYTWISSPPGFISSVKNPIVTPGATSVYTCSVVSGSQVVNPSATVTVNPVPFITVTSPNGAENYLQGSVHNITWNDNIAGDVKIELFKGGIFLQQLSASAPSSGVYVWTLTPDQQPGIDYRVRISGAVNTDITDESNADFTISADVPGSLSLLNETIISGQTPCYNATQTITVAGDGNPFSVDPEASVTMIAGQNIVYLPGTMVSSGGYMLGHLTTNGQYCAPPQVPPAPLPGSDGQSLTSSTGTSIQVYPNPTTGIFIFKLSSDADVSGLNTVLYDICGKPIWVNEGRTGISHELSLAGMPVGVYYLKVFSGTLNQTVKIIRQ